jgi:hypothetical protein
VQLPQLPNAVHERLLKLTNMTIRFLNNLTTDERRPDGAVAHKAAMPLTAFQNVKALAVCLRRKWGALGSFTTEVAFITRKLVGPDGEVRWSAPYFMRASQVGLGLSLGWLQSGHCYALLNEQAVEAFSHPRSTFNVVGGFLVDMNGSRLRPLELDSSWSDMAVSTDAHGGTMAKYFRMKAMMVDLSLNGEPPGRDSGRRAPARFLPPRLFCLLGFGGGCRSNEAACSAPLSSSPVPLNAPLRSRPVQHARRPQPRALRGRQHGGGAGGQAPLPLGVPPRAGRPGAVHQACDCKKSQTHGVAQPRRVDAGGQRVRAGRAVAAAAHKPRH